MATSSVFSRLDTRLQESLQLVGICDDISLAKMPAAQIWADMQEGWEHFPEKRLDLSFEMFARLHAAVQQSVRNTGRKVENAASKALAGKSENRAIPRGANLPAFAPARGTRLYHVMKSQEKEKAAEMLSEPENLTYDGGNSPLKQSELQAVRHRHSKNTYITAVMTCFIVPLLMSLVAVPFLIFFFKLGVQDLKFYGGIYGGILVFYWFFYRSARCAVCHMRVFSLRNFPRSKHAHHAPFIGYTLATALQVVFHRWFRCQERKKKSS